MQKIIDITGNKYHKLIVLGLDHISKNKKGKSRTYWKCQCDCGNIVVLRKDGFIYPYSRTKSCGCWHREESSKRLKDETTGKYITKKKKGGNSDDRKRTAS